MRIVPRSLAPASQVASRLSHFGTRNMLSKRHACPRALRPPEEHALDIKLANTAVSAPFYVAGSQRLKEPLKLFLTGAKAAAHATTSQGCSEIKYGKVIEIGAAGLQKDALQALLQAAQPAPCNSESVPDPSYRNALQIKTGSFGLSAVLPTPQMLHDISSLLQPAVPQIFAQLHKVNVYGPGGMFKAHVDTPTGAAQFGSLVVVLPSEFEGGELVVRHAGQSTTLMLGGGGNGGDSAGGSSRSGGSCSSDGPLLHFAAFFSDCIHEVLPVRSGHCVTLTFNLLLAEGEGEAAAAMQARRREQREEEAKDRWDKTWWLKKPEMVQQWWQQQPLLSAVQPMAGGSIPIVAKLRELLTKDTWYPEGCTLGYVLQHQYATSLRGLDAGMFPHALKGGDRLLHAALCGELGIKGTVRPLHFAKGEGRCEHYEDGLEDLDFVYVGEDFQDDIFPIGCFYRNQNGADNTRKEMEYAGFRTARDAAAVWIGLRCACSKATDDDCGARRPAWASMEDIPLEFTMRTSAYANGYEDRTTIYSGVVLLLEMPAWGTPERARAMAAVVVSGVKAWADSSLK